MWLIHDKFPLQEGFGEEVRTKSTFLTALIIPSPVDQGFPCLSHVILISCLCDR